MHIFTYGSLMFPEIWQRVVRGDYRSAPATAQGYARYALADDTYPSMVEQTEAMVEGVLYTMWMRWMSPRWMFLRAKNIAAKLSVF